MQLDPLNHDTQATTSDPNLHLLQPALPHYEQVEQENTSDNSSDQQPWQVRPGVAQISDIEPVLQDRHISGLYKLAEWNVNGIASTRNPYYTTFKLNVMTNLYHDFYILPEIHCLPSQTFVINNYTLR